MVRVPRSYWRAGLAGLAGSRPAVSPQLRRIHVTDIGAYSNLITVDLGNDGNAPLAIFNGAGNAQAQVGPQGLGTAWALDQCYVSTSVGQLDPAQAIVYVGPVILPNTAVTSSIAGGGSQFALGGLAVPDGWFVWAVWTGGTPGAQANLRVTGQKTVMAGPYGW